MRGLEAKFQDLIACARAFGHEVSPELPSLLDDLCTQLNINPSDLLEEIARRDGLVKVRLDTGKLALYFPDELQPAE